MSPGAKPFIPPLNGLEEADNIFTLRNVPDVDKIMDSLETTKPKKAVVVGAGFIGLEMAENLAKRGLEVTIVEFASHVLPTVDDEMAAFIHNELVDNGIIVHTEKGVVEIEDKGRTLILNTGEKLKQI